MSSTVETVDEGCPLSDEQRKAIETAGSWTSSALLQLGASYLDYSDAETRYLKAKADLVKHRGAAVQAEISRGNIVAAIAQELKLPPGKWTYSLEHGSLVKKES